MESKGLLARLRADIFTGLIIVLPAVVSFIILSWVFGTIANVTDTLLFFLPHRLTHKASIDGPGTGPMHWYWSVAALALAGLLMLGIGRLARNYFGRKMIEWFDTAMLRIPLFNKIYGAIKQVNDAFTAGGANSFKTVVLVEFPQPSTYSVGFLTNEQSQTIESHGGLRVVSVFIPTTPNPTSGFLLLVPEEKLTKLDMSVADAIKYIVSLGSIPASFAPQPSLKK